MCGKERNSVIELLRFIVAFLIVNFHIVSFYPMNGYFNHGNIGVSFFFIISGWFLAENVMKKEVSHENIGNILLLYICLIWIIEL